MLALQTGADYAFCQAGGFQFVNAGTTTHVDVDLSTLDCSGATVNLALVHSATVGMRRCTSTTSWQSRERQKKPRRQTLPRNEFLPLLQQLGVIPR
jgi:hypothetical protein